MQITVNGQERQIAENTTGSVLLDQLQITPATVVVEYNGEVMRRELFMEHVLADGDSLELVTLVGGG